MPTFLTTKKTASALEDVILKATEELVLISPYLKISKSFFERLEDASRKEISIKIVYGKDELQENQMQLLKSLKNLDLYFYQNLHAKCYYNESEMIITSMNMYEFSEVKNREMGILLQKDQDSLVFREALEETRSIINHAVQLKLNKSLSNLFDYKVYQNATKPLIPRNLSYLNWKQIGATSLNQILGETFLISEHPEKITFHSSSYTINCTIEHTNGNLFAVHMPLSNEYYDLLRPCQDDVRKNTLQNFFLNISAFGNPSSASLVNPKGVRTYHFKFVNEFDLPIFLESLMNFAIIIKSLRKETRTFVKKARSKGL